MDSAFYFLEKWSDIPRLCGIYRITDTRSGREYIGSAKDIHHRSGVHFRQLTAGTHHSAILLRTFKKYGWKDLVIDVLEIVSDPSSLLLREQVYIDARKPVMNMAAIAGSCVGVKHTAETLRKRSAATNAIWSNRTDEEKEEWGKRCSEQMRAWWSSATPQQRASKSSIARANEEARVAVMTDSQRAERQIRLVEMGRKAGRKRVDALSQEGLAGMMTNVLSAQMEWRAKHPEKVKEAAARMKATKASRTPEQKAAALAKFRATIARNPAKAAERAKRHREWHAKRRAERAVPLAA